MRLCDCGEAGMDNPCLPSCPYYDPNVIWIDEYLEMKQRLKEMLVHQESGLIHPSLDASPLCEVIDLETYREKRNR